MEIQIGGGNQATKCPKGSGQRRSTWGGEIILSMWRVIFGAQETMPTSAVFRLCPGDRWAKESNIKIQSEKENYVRRKKK